MTDAGFFRGTSADQDNRFADKQKKLLKEMNFSPILNTKLNMSKIDLGSLKPWIEVKIKDILEKDDELLSESIYEHLAEKEPDGKNMLVLITGFVEEQTKASKFVEELWTKLIETQDNANGVDTKNKQQSEGDTNNDTLKSSKTNQDISKSSTTKNSDQSPSSEHQRDHRDRSGSRSSEPRDPPSRSVSRSPGDHKLDERSRGRPRKRLVGSDDENADANQQKNKDSKPRGTSRSPADEGEAPKSKSGSRSRSKSGSRSRSLSKESGQRHRRQPTSGSKSRSRSGSRSYSRSYSRSSSRSPRRRSRSRSRDLARHRGRRSRSRSMGYRQRSISPRLRRGFSSRGPYRGPYGYNDRRRGYPMAMRRRPASPYGHRRRFSPRSPIRRRRSPSFSPRRRRSPSPYYRRPSRSRSPPPYGPGRHLHSPRPPMHGGHRDMMGGHHLPHHDTHGSMLSGVPRSPRGMMIDNRFGYGNNQVLPRHSPATFINKAHDLVPVQPSPGHMQPGPSVPQSPPSSGRKKHKKDKKHKKHKKSKKHRSASPERRKKHKKHKKSKKHKS